MIDDGKTRMTAGTTENPSKHDDIAIEEAPPPRRGFRAGMAGLFAATADRPFTRRQKLGIVFAVVLGAIVSLLRTTGTGPLQSIWEEDARDVLTDTQFMSGARTVVRPMVGYFVVVARLLGELADVFPLSWAAAVLSISSAVLTALMVVLVYHASGAHLDSRLARLLVSVPMLVAPIAENIRSEIYNRPVCLHFFMMYTLFWVLLWVPARRSGRIVACTAVGLSAFTTILTIGFIPLALVRAVVRRDKAGIIMFSLLITAALANAVARATGYASRGVSMRMDPVWALGEFVFRGLPQSVVGYRAGSGLDSVPNEFGTDPFWTAVGDNVLVIGLAWLLVFAIIAMAVRRHTAPNWPLVVVAALHTVALFCMMVMAQGISETRYLYPVEMLAFATFTLLLLPSAKTATRRLAGFDIRTAVVPLALFAVFVGIISVFNYRWHDTYRAQAPKWSDQVARAASECQRNPEMQKVYVRSAPSQFWSVVVIPCSRLRDRGPLCAPPSCVWIDSKPYVQPGKDED